jgi:FlaA1/EpsC-like NDP-sugar epimerase
MRLYKSIWRFASFRELQRITIATIITGIFHAVGMTVLYMQMPLSYYIIGIGIQYMLIAGIRFAYRFILLLRASKQKEHGTNAMIIGGGAAGTVLLRELRRAPEITDEVQCIIDDNKNKWGRDIDGVKVVGGRYEIPRAVQKYGIQKIYIAMPSISGKERKKISAFGRQTLPCHR